MPGGWAQGDRGASPACPGKAPASAPGGCSEPPVKQGERSQPLTERREERRGRWAGLACPGLSPFAEAEGNGDFAEPGVQGRSLSHIAILIKLGSAYFLSLLTKS